MLLGKKITVCVSGHSFAYIIPELISWLKDNKAFVQVALTDSASNYHSPQVLEELSGNRVAIDMFTLDDIWRAIHIDIAECDLFLIAQAEKGIIERICIGMADDLITSSVLATSAPVLIITDENMDMIDENIKLLSGLGYQFIFSQNNNADNIIEDLKSKITKYFCK